MIFKRTVADRNWFFGSVKYTGDEIYVFFFVVVVVVVVVVLFFKFYFMFTKI